MGSPADRPLWRCPRCGHAFVGVNMAHSCVGGRWQAHHFVVTAPTDLDAIPELPALVCEGYRDIGMQASLSASAR